MTCVWVLGPMRDVEEQEQGLWVLVDIRQKVKEQSGLQTEPEATEWRGPN